MNARQKAKKYKRMYENLLKQHKIDTLRFERFYPEAFITTGNSNYLREVIVKDIAQSLASGLGMTDVSDILTVSFDSGLKDESVLCVTRKYKGKTIILKMELGEQADILYYLLTE